jgi:16S rRNA (guanine527-N7)-methyltransferase
MFENHEIDSPESFAQLIDVSRETLDKLTEYVELLNKWQRRINLVGPKTLSEVWQRHFLDSAQVYTFIGSSDGPLLDLGSGAGFPGLVLSIMGIPNITLLESNQKKCSFLGEVIRQAGCDAQVFKGRIEDYPNKKLADTITARALAPLENLLAWSSPLLSEGGKCLFLKGENYEQELTAAEKRWTMEVQIHPSKADNTNKWDESAAGVLLEIGKLMPRDG